MIPTLAVNVSRVERKCGRAVISALINLRPSDVPPVRWVDRPGPNGTWLETDRTDAQALADLLLELGAPRTAVLVRLPV